MDVPDCPAEEPVFQTGFDFGRLDDIFALARARG